MKPDVTPSPVTIMLVDDDADGRFLAERRLKLAFPGCALISCESVDQAMERLAGVRPDAIVTDHQLGRGSGCELIRHVRKEGITCPVVMVTCSDDPEVAKAAMLAGATKVFRAGGDAFAEFLKRALAPAAPAPAEEMHDRTIPATSPAAADVSPLTLPLHPNMTSNSPPDIFQQLADGAPVMIWMSGLDMGCYYFNRAWLDFRGRSLEQEQGNGWAEGVHPEDMERCVNHYVSCFERRLSFAMSYRLQDHKGDYRWILDRGAPHSLPDGSFLGYYGGCVEISDDTPVARHAELHASLAAMKEFARRVATEGVVAMRAMKSSTEISFRELARHRHEDYAEQIALANHAADEIRRLTDDMVAHAGIGHRVCIPELKK